MESVGSLLLPPAQQPLLSTGRSLNHQTAAFVPKNTREEKESKLSGRNSPRVAPMALLQPQGLSLSSAWATKTMSLCPPCPQALLKATASATSGGLWHRGLAVQVTFDPARCCDSDQRPNRYTEHPQHLRVKQRQDGDAPGDSSKATGRARCHQHHGDSCATTSTTSPAPCSHHRQAWWQCHRSPR